MSLHVPYWAIPFIITVIIFAVAEIKARIDSPRGGIGGAVNGLVYGALAVIASMIVWIGFLLFCLWSR